METNNFNFEGENVKLMSHVGPDKVIYLTASGKINNNNLAIFTAWAEQIKQLMTEASREQGIVRVCTDVSGVEHFESKPIVPLRELFEHDKQYNMKSAIVGANFFMKNLMNAVIEFTGRTNVRQFPTKEEALLWLLKEEPIPAPEQKKDDGATDGVVQE
jgi:ABC-type transporter Mla MlaB component